MMYRQEDMPFTGEGITPDIIVNPHAIPSRMTIGQLMECIMGKACAHLGTYGNATAFNGVNVETLSDILEKCGMERHGNEILYNSRTGEQIHTEIFIGPTYYQRLKHMTVDKVHCFCDKTEILTTSGWIKFKDLTMKHKVASMVDNKLVYQYPSEVQAFDYNGPMYKIKNLQVDLKVTGNHRMYVRSFHGKKYRMELAEDIAGKRRAYKKNVDEFVPDMTDAPEELVIEDNKVVAFRLPGTDRVYNIDDWITLYGIWIAEGCNSKPDCATVIAAHKQRVKDALSKIESNGSFRFAKQKNYPEDRELNRWVIHDIVLGRYMQPQSVGATNKYLADWVWYLNREQCNQLMHAMCLGDGCQAKGKNWTYATSSTRLADDYQRLCLHAGGCCKKALHSKAGTVSYNSKIGIPVVSTADSFQLYHNTHCNEPVVNHRPIKQDTWKEYNGKVYCCTVPEGNGVIYVRRNGVPVWSGNSRSNNGPIILLTRQPAEGRCRDGGLRLGEMEVECNWAHGISAFLKERLMECSDNYRVFICKKCGLMANVNPEKNIYNCRNCKNITDFSEIRIPYAAKLLLQEVQTMSLGARFLTK